MGKLLSLALHHFRKGLIGLNTKSTCTDVSLNMYWLLKLFLFSTGKVSPGVWLHCKTSGPCDTRMNIFLLNTFQKSFIHSLLPTVLPSLVSVMTQFGAWWCFVSSMLDIANTAWFHIWHHNAFCVTTSKVFLLYHFRDKLWWDYSLTMRLLHQHLINPYCNCPLTLHRRGRCWIIPHLSQNTTAKASGIDVTVGRELGKNSSRVLCGVNRVCQGSQQ